MYGLPEDLDLSFFAGTALTQVGIGQFQIVFWFHPQVSLSVEAGMRLCREGATIAIGRHAYRERAGVLVSLIGHQVECAARTPTGALRLEFSSRDAVEVDDDNTQYESYNIRHGDRLIVV